MPTASPDMRHPGFYERRPRATAEDARRQGIPYSYSYKYWDPEHEPIFLIGNAFDAGSLGRWIFDWTVYCYGEPTPKSEIAKELGRVLVRFARKTKRAKDHAPRIHGDAHRELFHDFLEASTRIWKQFSELLRLCEIGMLKTAEQVNSNSVSWGIESGREFVEIVFGGNRELQRTKNLIARMECWSKRFDANCEDVLRSHSD